MYVFSNDWCAFCPEIPSISKDSSVVVIAVGNHASFHMLSYLLDDISPDKIKHMYFVDVSEAQLEHHKRTLKAIVDNPNDRLKIIEDMTGFKFAKRFHEDNDLLLEENVWDDCNIEGCKLGIEIKKHSDGTLWTPPPPIFHSDLELDILPNQNKTRTKVWAGYDYGFLRSQENLRSNLDKMQDRITYVCDDIGSFCSSREFKNSMVVVWISNIRGNFKSKPIQKRTNWCIWESTPDNKAKDGSPHKYATNALHQLAGDEVAEIHHSSRWACKRQSRGPFKSYEGIYYRDFLKSRKTFKCLSLHILLGNRVPVEYFQAVYKKARKCCDHLLVMEHNKDSLDKKDFPHVAMGIDEICSLIDVKDMQYIPGYFCNRRNVIIVCKRNKLYL